MEESFLEVEDVSDPSLMDQILIRLEEIQMEDEEFMQILLRKQNEMVITWEQPWYQQSNCITRPMNDSNKGEKDTFRADTISHDESSRIQKNWRRFRKIFKVPNTPISLARWRNKDKCRSPATSEEYVRRFVISFLAQGLERNLYQVYKYVVTNYGCPNKGPYSKYEENIMAVCIYHCPKNAVPYLSQVLSREPRGIYKRIWQASHGKPDKKKVKWTLSLATKFLNLLMEYLGESTIENLRQKQVEKSVWLKLEKDMGHQYSYLQKFWYDSLHVQLFVKSDVKLNKLRKKVLKVLKLYPYKVWTDIRWKEIANHFSDAFSHRFLYKLCYRSCKSFQGFRKHPLEDVINYGIQKSKKFRYKRLRTLVLNKNQDLEIIKYENKMKF